MFRLIQELNASIKMANEIAATKGEGPRWSLFLTNRSFIAQVVATLFVLMGAVGVALPVTEGNAVEIVSAVGFLVAQAWAGYERLTGRTRAVWNTAQADRAIDEAIAVSQDAPKDLLADALNRAVRG